MTIKVGDRIPEVEIFVAGDDGPVATRSSEIFAGKRVALFGVPGAFTRTCSARHLPGFVAEADALKARGVDVIACIAVNDTAVLSAWSAQHGAEGKVEMLGDGLLNFTRAAGFEVDLSGRGYGPRCKRFSMLVEDGVVKTLHLEEGGGFGETSAETLLKDL